MKTLRSKEYLAFVRSHPCLVTDQEFDVVAHHLRHKPHGGGMSLKPSDYRTVPLIPIEHHRLHAMGEVSYWAKQRIIPEIAVCDMLIVWLRDKYSIHASQVHDIESALEFITTFEKFIMKL